MISIRDVLGSGTETHLGKIEARAGSQGKLNRNVQVAGLLMVVIAFVAIVGFGYLQTDRTGADKVTFENAAASTSAE